MLLSFAVDICEYKGGLVAVKHLTPTANPESQEQLESFAREASLLRVLQHRYKRVLQCTGSLSQLTQHTSFLLCEKLQLSNMLFAADTLSITLAMAMTSLALPTQRSQQSQHCQRIL